MIRVRGTGEVMRRFGMPVSSVAWIFIAPLAPRGGSVTVGDGTLTIRAGLLGRASVPLDRIDAVATMAWPWWWGFGARIVRRAVAFVFSSGPAVRIDLVEPVRVRAPFGWRTSTLIVRVDDPAALVSALRKCPRDDPEPGSSAS